MALTPAQAAVIKATVPVLEEHGTAITSTFYRNMLAAHPELQAVFNTANQRNGGQPRALSAALVAYASHIDDLGALGPAVELICNKHASLYIQPAQYEIVGKYLLEAMAEVLGAALTPEIHEAWATAYWALARIMIDREAALYGQCGDNWTDWRRFRVARKQRESDCITSFYLAPADGRALPAFRPGQYVSVRVAVPGLPYAQPRQYSLSDQPSPQLYRISVKQEAGDAQHPRGLVSNVLHETTQEGDFVEVSHPFGDFFLDAAVAEAEAGASASADGSGHPPLVLISAGVGLTPLTAMLNTIMASTPQRKISFIHGARTSAARAFKSHFDALRAQHPASLQTLFFVSQPGAAAAAAANDYDVAGRIDLRRLDDVKGRLFLDDPRTRFYVCGPGSFMTDMRAALLELGVSEERIRMERFGTGGV